MIETKKNIFNIFAAFGPGGALATISEKIFRRLFNQGYEVGDDTEFQAPEDVLIRKHRQDYLNELFDMKGDFERKMGTKDEVEIEEAYMEFNELVEKYIDMVRGLEKKKINKAKIFYNREGNQ